VVLSVWKTFFFTGCLSSIVSLRVFVAHLPSRRRMLFTAYCSATYRLSQAYFTGELMQTTWHVSVYTELLVKRKEWQ
jgi:hypothetical protein